MLAGVGTRRFYSASTLGYTSPDLHDYAAVPYLVLDSMFEAIPKDVKRSGLIDYGCGLGRVLVVAHDYGFARVIGVELAEPLVLAARRNMQKYAGCEIVHIDAAQFDVPDDVTVFYFGNPFGGVHLDMTLTHIWKSLDRYPRPHAILGYYNNETMAASANRIGLRLEPLSTGTTLRGKSWTCWRVGSQAVPKRSH